ncbi:MAG: hypothetical protein ACREV1_15390, partial [Gammaproteobacteria bacterium]
VIQTDFDESDSPFSLREKVRMRGIKSNTCVDYSDLLTPTISLWEREKYLSRKDRDLGKVTQNFTYVWLDLFTTLKGGAVRALSPDLFRTS